MLAESSFAMVHAVHRVDLRREGDESGENARYDISDEWLHRLRPSYEKSSFNVPDTGRQRGLLLRQKG